MLQASQKTTAPNISKAALRSRGHLYFCIDWSQKSALCSLPCGDKARGDAGAGILPVTGKNWAHLGVVDEVSYTLIFSRHPLRSQPSQRRRNINQSMKYPPEMAWCGSGYTGLVHACSGRNNSLLTWTEPLGSGLRQNPSWCNDHQQGLT